MPHKSENGLKYITGYMKLDIIPALLCRKNVPCYTLSDIKPIVYYTIPWDYDDLW